MPSSGPLGQTTDWSFRSLSENRSAQTSAIVSELIDGISRSGIAPGEKLPPERALAEMLGVGRSPLREALKSLDVLGLIEVRQGDGTYLSSSPSRLINGVIGWGVLLDSAHARELIESRYFVEAALATLAAERATEEQLAVIHAHIDDMEHAQSASDFADADSRFHFAIAAAADNTVLAGVLERTKSLLTQWIVRVVDVAADRAELIRQHRVIADALSERNAEAAAQAMREHIDEVTRRLRAALTSNDF